MNLCVLPGNLHWADWTSSRRAVPVLFFCSGALSGTGKDKKEFPDCVFMEMELLVPDGSALTGLSLLHGIFTGTLLEPGWAWVLGQHKAQDQVWV